MGHIQKQNVCLPEGTGVIKRGWGIFPSLILAFESSSSGISQPRFIAKWSMWLKILSLQSVSEIYIYIYVYILSAYIYISIIYIYPLYIYPLYIYPLYIYPLYIYIYIYPLYIYPLYIYIYPIYIFIYISKYPMIIGYKFDPHCVILQQVVIDAWDRIVST